MGTEDGSGSSNQLSVYQGTNVDRHSDSHPRDISQISKHLEILPVGGSGTSKHPETHPQVTLGIGNIDHIYIHSDFIDGNRSRDHFNICSEVVDESRSCKFSETHPAVCDRIDSSKLMLMHPDTTSNQNDPTKKLRTSSSSSSSVSLSQDLFQVELRPSSSSSVSLSQDLFQVDTEGLSKSTLCTTFSPKPEVDTQPAFLIDETNTPSSNYSRSQELDNVSFDITSISQGSQVTDEFSVHDFPPTQSPPIQVMERAGEYDPFRIPSSIFERSESTAPQEWSNASNESLFSIRIGNNSLSRESFLMLGGDTFRSGEFMFSPNTSVSVVGAESFELEKSKATGELEKCLKVETRETTEGQSKEQAPPTILAGLSPSLSDQSNDSAYSFAFPVKECKRKNCVWPLCYCSNFSCTFCYCLWPSWPSCYCSNCSWAFCYCWNGSPKRWSTHSSAILTERPRSNLAKADVEKQQQKPQATEVTSKSVACNWFSCFSCCPRCCCSFFCCPGCSCSSCSCCPGCSCSSCSSSRWSWPRPHCSCPRCSCHHCWCC